jgi:hypothetical protein
LPNKTGLDSNGSKCRAEGDLPVARLSAKDQRSFRLQIDDVIDQRSFRLQIENVIDQRLFRLQIKDAINRSSSCMQIRSMGRSMVALIILIDRQIDGLLAKHAWWVCVDKEDDLIHPML